MGITQILLEPYELVAVLALLGWIVWAGRPEVGLGLYIALPLWTRTVLIGPVAHTWVVLAATVGASLVYLHRTRRPLSSIVPPWGRWIIPWMICWWAWMIIILMLFGVQDKREVLRPLLVSIVTPLPIAMLFGHSTTRIRNFALAFIGTTLVGGWKALQVLEITTTYWLSDPTLTRTGIIRLGLINYHWFAYAFAISLILSLGLFIQARSKVVMALMLATAATCVYFLFMAGSRQSLNAGGAAALLLMAWSIYHRGTPKVRTAVVAGLLILLALVIFQTAPSLIIRSNESDLGDTFDIVGDRSGLWAKGFSIFAGSPLWGTGFEDAVYAHNIFVSALADQGVIGFIFLIGFLLFYAARSRQVWEGPGPKDRATWRMTMMCVGVFGLIHSQASSDSISVWHLYWSAVFLWWQGRELEIAPRAVSAVRRRVEAMRPTRRPQTSAEYTP